MDKKNNFNQDESLAEIMNISRNIERLDYYELLGIDESATARDAKKAYFELARKFHPDLFSKDLDPESRDKVADVFDNINKAYQTISHGPKRQAYNKSRETRKETQQQTGERRAEAVFSKGRNLYNQARYEEAVSYFTEAVRMKEQNPQYLLYKALAESHVPLFIKQAEEDFLKVIRMEPWNSDGMVGLGRLYNKSGLPLRAEKYFRRALELDPKNMDAQKELKQFKGKGKQGLKEMFSFGKKRK